MASYSRICSKQQSLFSNKSITIHGKLWKRVENRSRYQEKIKNREDNKVCKENEESIEESRNNIKKSIERDEETSK